MSFFTDDSVGKSAYVKLSSQSSERPDLGNARIVVTGGRGVKSAENFKMIDKLAEKIGAAGFPSPMTSVVFHLMLFFCNFMSSMNLSFTNFKFKRTSYFLATHCMILISICLSSVH